MVVKSRAEGHAKPARPQRNAAIIIQAIIHAKGIGAQRSPPRAKTPAKILDLGIAGIPPGTTLQEAY
jgi:hypothetical protein